MSSHITKKLLESKNNQMHILQELHIK